MPNSIKIMGERDYLLLTGIIFYFCFPLLQSAFVDIATDLISFSHVNCVIIVLDDAKKLGHVKKQYFQTFRPSSKNCFE